MGTVGDDVMVTARSQINDDAGIDDVKASPELAPGTWRSLGSSSGLGLRARMLVLERECTSSFDSLEARLESLQQEHLDSINMVEDNLEVLVQECTSSVVSIEEEISTTEKHHDTMRDLPQQRQSRPCWLTPAIKPGTSWLPQRPPRLKMNRYCES